MDVSGFDVTLMLSGTPLQPECQDLKQSVAKDVREERTS